MVKIDHISASSAESFLNCKLKFLKDKELRKKMGKVTNPLAEHGSFTHFCLEVYFKLKSSHYNENEIKQIEKIKYSLKEIKLLKKSLQTHYDDKDLTFSVLKEIAEKHVSSYNVSDKKKSPITELKQINNMFEKMVYDPYRLWFTIKPEQIILVEFKFDIVSSYGYPMLGYIDLVLDMGHEIYMIDWKSGGMFYSVTDLEALIQFDFYAVAQSLINKFNKKVRYILDMTLMSVIYVYKTDENIEIADSFFANLWDEMQEFSKSKKKPEPTLNRFCSWCLHKSDCKAIKIAKEMKIDTDVDLDKTKIEILAEKYKEYQQKESIFKKLKEKYKDGIKKYYALNEIIDDTIETKNDWIIKLSTVEKSLIKPMALIKFISLKEAVEAGMLEVAIGKMEKVLDKEQVKELKDKAEKFSYQKISITKTKIKKIKVEKNSAKTKTKPKIKQKTTV